MTIQGRTSVLIPAYEEEFAIGALVENIHALGRWNEILVVDDGSKDRTAERARAAGATVIRHPYNKGNGAAVKTAVRAATGEFILLLDADGQHPLPATGGKRARQYQRHQDHSHRENPGSRAESRRMASRQNRGSDSEGGVQPPDVLSLRGRAT